MSLRRRRCTECSTLFYTADMAVTECQDCTGTYNPTAARAKDAENIHRVNTGRVTTGRRQSVDPRTGKPRTQAPVAGQRKQTAPAELVAEASKKTTTKKAPKGDAS